MEPTFFPTPADLKKWFDENHETQKELLVGYYKKDTGKPSITWPESVDEALCVGWIDGIRRSLDAESYTIRFTPRKPTSNWSWVNIARVESLTGEGRMKPAGLAAFALRTENQSGIYAYEQRDQAELTPAEIEQIKANPQAWDFFERQPKSYRKSVLWWIVSAKQEATRARRVATLIEDSANGRTIKQYTRPTKK
ncbi:MAG: YdeI/OmpD-associated family protein [Chloroflexi bacterium]|nr:YdeI/OmpD-associated family protein [Chloroflexota bacterium]MCC6894371.1 YdeI/OmpD-associated family protein [Anaerolineae bacterium]